MSENHVKKIPYGISDFERVRQEDFYYVDKTAFIINIENSPPYLFFLRPRRFGKSLWLSLMECYYDIERKEQFEELFKDTYIYDNFTEEKNKYLILKFNFSEVSSEISEVRSSFNKTIKRESLGFIKKYRNYIDEPDNSYKIIEKEEDASEILKYLVNFVKDSYKIYLLIDEYDNFSNTIISSSGKEQYMAITHGEGFYRHFFNVIKAGTTGSGAPISKIFITGVSPVTMDDVTSGFNIGSNISMRPGFNEMVGFTEGEVINILKYYEGHILINEPFDKMIDIMKKWYNNYLFSEDGKNRLYNSDMVLYFLSEYMGSNKIPKEMLDHNIKIDYNKLKYLIIVDSEGKLQVNGNFEKLKYILEGGVISSNIANSFPVDRVIDTENFISLLYYFGLLTISPFEKEEISLIIPNEVVRQLYYEYILEAYRDTDIFKLDLFKLKNLFREFAYRGKWEDLMNYVTGEMSKQIALRDYIRGEKAIQTFLRVYLNFSNYYITRTEYELNRGYGDIILLPHFIKYPEIKYSYIIEVKYMSVTEYSEKKLEDKINEARKELKQYEEDDTFGKFKGRTELLKIILVFCGVELKYKELFL